MTSLPHSKILYSYVVILCLAGLGFVSAESAVAETWTRLAFEGLGTTAVEVDPTNRSVLYLGFDSGLGVAKSVDGGVTWNTVNSGLTLDASTSVAAFAIDRTAPNTVYVGLQVPSENPVLYKTTNGGTSWSASSAGLPGATITAIVIDPATPTTLYASMNGFGVYKSTDGGTSWSDANNGLEDGVCAVSCVLDLALDRDLPTTLYAAVPTLASVYKSTDGGANWSATPTSIMAEDLAMDPFDAQTLLASASLGGFERTTDGAATWSSLEGAGSGLPPGAVFNTIAYDREQPDHVFVEADFEVYRSMDGGDTWTLFNDGLEGRQINTLGHNGVLALASTDDGLYASPTALFADGFESGDTSIWSFTTD